VTNIDIHHEDCNITIILLSNVLKFGYIVQLLV